MTDTNPVQREATEAIIEAFGGIAPLATALGHRNPSTVQGWKERGRIPSQQQPSVLSAAQKKRLGIGPQHFLIPYEADAA